MHETNKSPGKYPDVPVTCNNKAIAIGSNHSAHLLHSAAISCLPPPLTSGTSPVPLQPAAHTRRSSPVAAASPFDTPRPGPNTGPGIVEPGTGAAVGLFVSYCCCSVDMGQAAAALCARVACELVAALGAETAEGVLLLAVWGGVAVAVAVNGAVHASEMSGCG